MTELIAQQERLQDKYKDFDVIKALQPLTEHIQGKITDCLNCSDYEIQQSLDVHIDDLIRILNNLPPYFLSLMIALEGLSDIYSKDIYYGYFKLAQCDLNVAVQKQAFARESKHNG